MEQLQQRAFVKRADVEEKIDLPKHLAMTIARRSGTHPEMPSVEHTAEQQCDSQKAVPAKASEQVIQRCAGDASQPEEVKRDFILVLDAEKSGREAEPAEGARTANGDLALPLTVSENQLLPAPEDASALLPVPLSVFTLETSVVDSLVVPVEQVKAECSTSPLTGAVTDSLSEGFATRILAELEASGVSNFPVSLPSASLPNDADLEDCPLKTIIAEFHAEQQAAAAELKGGKTDIPTPQEAATPRERETVTTFQEDYERYLSLAGAEAWDELAKETEKKLSADDGTARSQLHRTFWLRAELRRGEVPLQILSAPLESLLDRVVKQPEDDKAGAAVRSECAKLGREFAQTLSESGKSALAASVLEQIRPLSQSSDVVVLEDSVKRQRVSDLEATPLYKLSDKEKERLVSLKQELETQDALEQRSGGEKEEDGIARRQSWLLRRAPSRRWVAIGMGATALFVCLVVPLAALIMLILPASSARDGHIVHLKANSSAGASYPVARDALISPDLRPMPLPGELDMLLYNLRSTPRAEPHRQLNTNSGDSAAPEPTEPSRGGVAQPVAEQQAARELQRVQLSMDGPVEPQEVRDAISGSRAATAERRQEPRVIDRDFVLSGGLTVDSIPNAAATRGQGAREQGTGGGRNYRITTRTHVLQAPSYSASSLGELSTGAVVEVIQEQDRWLEIRSREGNVGFIPLQNATPDGRGTS